MTSTTFRRVARDDTERIGSRHPSGMSLSPFDA